MRNVGAPGYGAAQDEERTRLAEIAQQVAASCLSGTTVAASTAVIKAIQPNRSRGAIAEPAADLRQIRTDPRLLVALRRDMDIAQGQALILIGDALWMGFRSAANSIAASIPASGGAITVDLTPEDRADAADYPILGLTTGEWAQSLRRQLQEGVDRALGGPLTAGIDPTLIPGALGQVATAHADRVSGAVEQAHAAGAQCALRAVADALTGAA